MVFFRTGCVKRRSTRTTMVLSCLSLTTTPWSVRFGITVPLLRLGRALRLPGGLRFCSPLRLGGSLWRGGRRGIAAALLPRDGLHARDVAAHHADARRVLELTGGPLEAQIELLLLQLEHLVVELIDGHSSYVGGLHLTHSYS